MSVVTDSVGLHIGLIYQQDGSSVTCAQLRECISECESYLDRPGLFDYEAQVNVLVQGVLRQIERIDGDGSIVRDALVSPLSEIYSAALVPFGEAWSRENDIAFAAGSDHGNQVVFPNANAFDAGLIAFWREATGSKRVYFDYFFRCLRSPPHEVVHCLQVKTKQRDTTNWLFEHDASFLAWTLMALVDGDCEAAQRLFPTPGLYEANLVVAMDLLEALRTRLVQSDPGLARDLDSAYTAWRDSFGRTPLPDAIGEHPDYGVRVYCKLRLAVEGMCPDTRLAFQPCATPEEFAKLQRQPRCQDADACRQLAACFRGRTDCELTSSEALPCDDICMWHPLEWYLERAEDFIQNDLMWRIIIDSL